MSDTPDETIEESSEVAEVPEPEMFGCSMTDSRGQLVLHVERDRYLDVAKQLADEGYAMCVDLTAVDYSEYMERALPSSVTAERFEVVVNLLDITHRRRIRLRVQVPEGDAKLQLCSTSTQEPKRWSEKYSTCSGLSLTVTPTHHES